MGFWIGVVFETLKCPAKVWIDGEIAVTNRKSVAELIGHFVVVFFYVVYDVFDISGKSAAIAQGCADLLDAEGCFVVCTGNEGVFLAGQVVRVELYADAVHYLGYVVG